MDTMKLTSALLLSLTIAAVDAADTIILAQDVDYPPYASATADGEPTGFAYDVALGVDKLCPDITIEINLTAWNNCWSSEGGGTLGALVDDGTLDGCMTYTHTTGVRNEFADFSYGILKDNKAAGLMTLLDKDGMPAVNGTDDLSGRTVVDVGGWAPTADALDVVENKCTGKMYSSDYTLVTGDGPDESMTMLRNGTAEAMFVYADQAYQYQCAEVDAEPTWNCTLWEGFGTEYAYVQTGQFGHAVNGTTLILAKKGSGIVEKVNPCIQAFMETKEYYDACVKYSLVEDCYPNSFFPSAEGSVVPEYNRETNEHDTDCSDGYCKCPTDEVDAGGDSGDSSAAPEAAEPSQLDIVASSALKTAGIFGMGLVIVGVVSSTIASCVY